MTPFVFHDPYTSFCYLLHGFFELTNTSMLSSKQLQQIKDYLDLVFTKVTPDRNKKSKKIIKIKKPEGLNFIPEHFNIVEPGKLCSNNTTYCSKDLGSRKIC